MDGGCVWESPLRRVSVIVLTILSLALGITSTCIGGWTRSIEPLTFLPWGVLWMFGILLLMSLFRACPGRLFQQPIGGVCNLAPAAVIRLCAKQVICSCDRWVNAEAAGQIQPGR